MANIMIRKSEQGYVFYMPKRDIEDSIVSMEFDTPEKWGGEIKLGNGGLYYIEPQAATRCAPSASTASNEKLKGETSWQ